MATSENSAPKGSLLSWLATHRASAGTGVMIVGVAIAVVPTLLASWYGADFLGAEAFTGLLALLVVGVGVTIRFLPDEAAENPNQLLSLVLLLGGVGGLLIALTGAALTYHWSALLTDWLSAGKREGAGLVLLAFAVFLGGLFVMFSVLQLGRAEERRNPNIRRLMYGYNAVFSGVLLLLILAVINVLVALKLTWAVDATSSGEFSLSDRTINLVKGLDRPLHIYVIWPQDADRTESIRGLLDSLQDRSPQVQVEYVSPTQQSRVAELMKTYPKIESIGILLVYGEQKPENATFLKEGDLFEEGFGNTPTRFRGEDKIAAALSGLETGGQKTVVYVTQGSGEPNLNDSARTPPRPGAEGGLGVLRDRLTARGNFDVRPLKLTPAETKIPDDCKLLVVASPKPPVDRAVVQAIRHYLEGAGKAVFLLDVPAPATGPTMPATGLEQLLGEYNVEVTPDRIMSFGQEQIGDEVAFTGRVVLEINPDLAQARTNEVASAFVGYQFASVDVRLVRPAPPGGRRPELQTQTLLQTLLRRASWVEHDWQADFRATANALFRRDKDALAKLSKDPLPAAVVATVGGKGKLAVFGDVTFVTNRYVSEQSGTPNFSFFASLLDWLAERPTSIGIDPRNLSVYSMDQTARISHLVFLPGLLAAVTILGLGLGVWVVRRR